MSDTKQPVWKLVANLGDVHPLDHGGYFVFVDETGVYPPEAELLDVLDADEADSYRVYRFILEPCTYVNGVLSDNKFHPEHPAWFADSLKDIARSCGQDFDEELQAFLSNDPLVRAQAWRDVGEHNGFENLDHYPLTLTREEAQERIAKYRDGR